MHDTCAWRHFDEGNRSVVAFNNYFVETLLHELLLQSPHRWARGGGGRGYGCCCGRRP